jgi:hypothetical protein
MAQTPATPTLSFDDFYSTTLSSAIASTDTTIPVAAAPTATEGYLVLEPDSATNREVIHYTSVSGNNVICPSVNDRGLGGTTARAHSSGAIVKMNTVAEMLKSLQDGTALSGLHTAMTDGMFDFVVSGCVITADSAGSTLNWSMTAGVVRINGRRYTVAAVSASAATANKDTYVDVLANSDGTTTLVTTGGNIVANNAASPALAGNSLRLGIIVTAANIAAAASINQGQPDRVLPIASSVPYTTTDSLGNLICPRDPNRKVLGYRQITTPATTASTSTTATNLISPVIVPTGRRVKISFTTSQLSTTASTNTSIATIWDGTAGSGTLLQTTNGFTNGGWTGASMYAVQTPSATSKTYSIGLAVVTSGTANITAASTSPASILVELV